MPIQSLPVVIGLLAAFAWPCAGVAAPIRIVALGDSLTAGLGLDGPSSFTTRLEDALKAAGHDVVIVNAGVSGDTASDGLARIDWSVGDDADAVIVELGANDALRGVDPGITRDAADRILARLTERKLPTLLTGMMAPPNMGGDYAATFNRIYPELAAKHGVLFYPFFLDGVAANPKLNQADGIHPNAKGVDVIVERILPAVEDLIGKVETSRTGAIVPAPVTDIATIEGDTPCRASLPASRFPPNSASGWRSFAADCPAPAGSTARITTSRFALSAMSTGTLPARSWKPSTG